MIFFSFHEKKSNPAPTTFAFQAGALLFKSCLIHDAAQTGKKKPGMTLSAGQAVQYFQEIKFYLIHIRQPYKK